MSSRHFLCHLMVALMAVCNGCHPTDEAALQESESPKRQDAVHVPNDGASVQEPEAPKGQNAVQVSDEARKSVTEEQAVRIAEAEVRERVRIKPGNTLRSDATHYDPGEARREQGGVHGEGGWSVIVWLVPTESAGHWFVFVTDGGSVAEFVGGA